MFTIKVTIQVLNEAEAEVHKQELAIKGTVEWLLRLPWGQMLNEAFNAMRAAFNVGQSP